MRPFHGDLLLGGAALRNLDGILDDGADDGADGRSRRWSGHFRVDLEQRCLLETGRPYLLLLADGRSERVVLTELREDAEQQSLAVQFDAPGEASP